jgi:hypothetical protein
MSLIGREVKVSMMLHSLVQPVTTLIPVVIECKTDVDGKVQGCIPFALKARWYCSQFGF